MISILQFSWRCLKNKYSSANADNSQNKYSTGLTKGFNVYAANVASVPDLPHCACFIIMWGWKNNAQLQWGRLELRLLQMYSPMYNVHCKFRFRLSHIVQSGVQQNIQIWIPCAKHGSANCRITVRSLSLSYRPPQRRMDTEK